MKVCECMSVDEYKQLVVELFKSGEATDEMWQEMSAAVLGVSETSGCPAIEAIIYDCEDVA